MADRYMSVQSAAKLLGVTKWAIYYHIRKERIQAIKRGYRVLVSVDDIRFELELRKRGIASRVKVEM